jgi:predicted ester cyclase
MARTMKIVGGLLCGALLAGPACKKADDGAAGAGAGKATEATKAPPVEPPKAEPPKPFTPEERAANYASCWSHLNERDWDAFGKCYAADAVSEHVDTGMAPAQGAAINDMAKGYFTAFADLKGQNALTLVNGTKVVSLNLMSGTQSGELKMGEKTLPATGKPVGYLMGHVAEYGDDNQVHKEWIFSDQGTFLNQLGLSPQPGRPLATKLDSAPVVVIAKDSEAEQANVAAHRKLNEQWNKRDKTMMDAYADDVVVVDAGGPDKTGKKAILDGAQMVWKGFSDARGEAVELWGAGDYTVAIMKNEGTNDGDVKAWKLKKTGKPISFTSLDIIRWEGGKAKQAWMIANMMTIPMQLGLIPQAGGKPGEAPGANVGGEPGAASKK